MNVNSVEQSLAKYHLLHFVLGVVLAAALVLLPKVIAIILVVVLVALFAPIVLIPDFTGAYAKYLSGGATVLGAIIVAVVLHFLHRL